MKIVSSISIEQAIKHFGWCAKWYIIMCKEYM